MKVTTIIPSYNEEKMIKEIILGVKPYSDEVLTVVARKSSDNTAEIAKSLGSKVIIDSGKGKGAALRLGVKHSKGDIIVFIDADGSHSPKDIPKLVAPIKKGVADFVVGSRPRGGSDEMQGTFTEFSRNVGGALIMLCINYSLGVRFTDCENGFRAIKKDVFLSLNLKANDFDIEQEMCIKAIRKKVRLIEVPTHEYRRRYGTSRLHLFKIGWKFIWRLRDCFL